MAPVTGTVTHRDSEDGPPLPAVACFLQANDVQQQLDLLDPSGNPMGIGSTITRQPGSDPGLTHRHNMVYYDCDAHDVYPGSLSYTSLEPCTRASLEADYSPVQMTFQEQLLQERDPTDVQSQHDNLPTHTDAFTALTKHEACGDFFNGYDQDHVRWPVSEDSDPTTYNVYNDGQWQCHLNTAQAQSHMVHAPILSKVNKRQRRCLKLQHWLLFLLEKPEEYSDVIVWLDRSHGIFTFLDSKKVATYWGEKKGNNTNMTYEHMARAMRHYYKSGIMSRVRDRRLVYKFGDNADMWKRVMEGYPVVLQG